MPTLLSLSCSLMPAAALPVLSSAAGVPVLAGMRGDPGPGGEPGRAPAALLAVPLAALLSGRLLSQETGCLACLALLAAAMAARCSGVGAGEAAVANMTVMGVVRAGAIGPAAALVVAASRAPRVGAVVLSAGLLSCALAAVFTGMTVTASSGDAEPLLLPLLLLALLVLVGLVVPSDAGVSMGMVLVAGAASVVSVVASAAAFSDTCMKNGVPQVGQCFLPHLPFCRG